MPKQRLATRKKLQQLQLAGWSCVWLVRIKMWGGVVPVCRAKAWMAKSRFLRMLFMLSRLMRNQILRYSLLPLSLMWEQRSGQFTARLPVWCGSLGCSKLAHLHHREGIIAFPSTRFTRESYPVSPGVNLGLVNQFLCATLTGCPKIVFQILSFNLSLFSISVYSYLPHYLPYLSCTEKTIHYRQ